MAVTAATSIRDGGAALLALALACLAAPAAAQTAPAAFDPPSYLTPAPLRADNPLLSPSRDYTGIPASDWMLYPDFLAGGIYNDNLNQTQTGRVGAFGARLQPDFTGVRDVGASKTSVFANLDAMLYPGQPRDDSLDGRIGFAQSYEVRPDLVVKAQAEYDRLSTLIVGGQLETPAGIPTTLVSPQQYQQWRASAALQKTFGRYFVGLSLGAVQTNYDSLATTAGSLSQSYRDNVVTTLTGRAGYWLMPMLYGYAEAAGNLREYADDPLNSRGYRAVAGLGSDRISLFRGELYAGYQRQDYGAPLAGAASTPVFGGKVFWYPTRAWTVSTSLDEAFSDSSNPTPSNPRGDPARVTTAQGNAAYQLAREWSATAFVRFDHSEYLGVDRTDNAWTLGARVNYEIARDFHVSLDYSYIQMNSNAAGASFFNNVVGLGGVYKF